MRALEALGVAGTPGRKLAARIDLVRSTGVGQVARRLRDPERLDALEQGRDELYREIWSGAAREIGAAVHDLGHGFLELRLDGRATRVWQQWTALDDAVSLRLALDKEIVARLLREAGVSIPEGVEFQWRRLEEGLEFLRRAGGACVVKPASGTGGGVGITSGVRRADQLRRAALRAARSGNRVRIERQSEGTLYRLLFLDGVLVDTVRRLPPRLAGDGRSTVEELIAGENRRRVEARGRRGLDLLTVDLDCVFTLARQGLNLRSVPPAGTLVTVKTVTNESRPDDNETVRDPDEELVSPARRAAAAVGLRLAGVDLIAGPAASVVLEVNGTPGLHHHYLVADRERATPVAGPILRALLR